MLVTLVFVVILGTDTAGRGTVNSEDHNRVRRHLYPSDKERPCPDGGTCCSRTFFDSDVGNQSFYLKCDEIPVAYPPCRRVHRTQKRFPGCCPLLVCPPFFTYLDAYVFTISLLMSRGEATLQYGRRGHVKILPVPLEPQ